MCYSIFDYKGEFEEFTFRRKVFDGYPMPEKTYKSYRAADSSERFSGLHVRQGNLT